jgi:GNAT superfamily N-acetyltransferase
VTAYQVALWSSDRLDPVVELHHRTFGLEPDLSLRYLRWKYFSNPYLAEPTLFVATNPHGQVVGMRGFYGTCWRDDGRSEVIPCADDFAIAGADRNTGLMTQLMREAIDTMARRGHVQLLNLSGSKSTVLQALATGWRSCSVP